MQLLFCLWVYFGVSGGLVWSCLVLSCLVLPCLALCCLVLSRLVSSCLVLPWEVTPGGPASGFGWEGFAPLVRGSPRWNLPLTSQVVTLRLHECLPPRDPSRRMEWDVTLAIGVVSMALLSGVES